MVSANLEAVVTRIGIAVERLTESQQETDRIVKKLAEERAERIKERAQERVERDREWAEWAQGQAIERAKERAERDREWAEWAQEQALERAKERAEALRAQEAQNAKYAKHREEIEWRLTKTVEELSKEVKAMMQGISTIGHSLGALIEFIVIPGIRPLMKEHGRSFDNIFPNKKIKALEREVAEVDIFLHGNAEAMAVEIKTRLTVSDVRRHIERLKTLRTYANEADIQNKKLYGAVVGLFIDGAAQTLAQQEGLYVIEIVEERDRLEIVSPVDNIKPF
ncbi:MAG: hypothetical protein LBC70_02650 [Chitinispirillales bacterium]|nr:hypothetical protein [Chitinispirillales bacterium]